MKTNPKKSASIHVLNAFWDTSAVVALCCVQKQSSQAKQAARVYARQVVWWGTSVEAISALNRLIREGYLTANEIPQAFAKLNYLRRRWVEIEPASEVRNQAERLWAFTSSEPATASACRRAGLEQGLPARTVLHRL